MTAQFRVRGLHCSQEAALIQKRLANMPGVDAVTFEILEEKMTVEMRAPAETAQILAGISELGMSASPWQEQTAPPTWWQRWGQVTFCALSGLFMLAGMIFEAREADNFWLGLLAHQHGAGEEHHELELFPFTMFALAVVLGAWYLVPKAWRALRAKHLDMNILVLIALVGAVAMEEYTEAANLAFLFALANLVELWSLRRAAAQIRQIKAEIAHQPHHHHHDAGMLPATEQFMDRFARWYTPVLLVLAALVALALPLAGANRAEWLNLSLMILLTACPCALVISTPVTIAASLAAAARHGAFVPHGLALEQAAASDDALRGLVSQHQVVLRPEDQPRFRFLREHATRAMFTMKMNVAIAVLAKIAFLVLALMGKASLWMAVASDLGAMLVVTLIGLRMLHAPEPEAAPISRTSAA
jgi:cation transport ATPase